MDMKILPALATNMNSQKSMFNPINLTQKLVSSLVNSIFKGEDIETSLTNFNQDHQSPLSNGEVKELTGLMEKFLFRQEVPMISGGKIQPEPPIEKKSILNDGTIQDKRLPHLEHGDLKKVNAIVLHQTNTKDLKDTIEVYKKQSTGAHLLIEKDGSVYLTANLDKITWHAGRVTAKCDWEKPCRDESNVCSEDEKDQLKKIKKQYPKTYLKKWRIRESKKNYPERYPMNKDSIGIEIISLHDPGMGYKKITLVQKKSLDELTQALKNKYNLTNNDIYAHTIIARKDEECTEGTNMGH